MCLTKFMLIIQIAYMTTTIHNVDLVSTTNSFSHMDILLAPGCVAA